MIARFGDADLEEVRESEHRVGGNESTARVTPHRGLVDVDPRVAAREIFHPGYLVRDRVVATHGAVIRVVKRLRTTRCTAAIHGYNDEAEFSERLAVTAGRGECPASHTPTLRT